MKLALKTRDNWAEDYLFEVHKAGCSHLKREATGSYEFPEDYSSGEELVKHDMECSGRGEENKYLYKIMPCVK